MFDLPFSRLFSFELSFCTWNRTFYWEYHAKVLDLLSTLSVGPAPSRCILPEEHLKAMIPSSPIPVSTVGVWPTWPETLAMARRRFAERLLVYISRGAKALCEGNIGTPWHIMTVTLEMAVFAMNTKCFCMFLMHNGILRFSSGAKTDLIRLDVLRHHATPGLKLDIPQEWMYDVC